MSNEYQYILDPGSKKHTCPNCGKRRYVRYINASSGDYLPITYGRCDREAECRYHLNPYTDGYHKTVNEVNKVNTETNKIFSAKTCKDQSEPVYIPFEVLEQTLHSNWDEHNRFLQNLLHRVSFPFDAQDVDRVVTIYNLGTITNGYRSGALTLPFINSTGKICAIQVKEFDDCNHTIATDFLHSIIEKNHLQANRSIPHWLESYLKQPHKVNCLFGEHLLNRYPNKPVALVEAPKTAIYGTLYFGHPEISTSPLWLAVYNKSTFSLKKLKVLQGRDVIVFPDLSSDGGTFREWQNKAKEIENKLPGTRFIFSDLIENNASENERSNGCDLADFLIKLDWRQFRKTLQDENKAMVKSEEFQGAILRYWKGYPEALEDFRVNLQDRNCYFNEFSKEYQEIDYDTFEQYSINIKLQKHER